MTDPHGPDGEGSLDHGGVDRSSTDDVSDAASVSEALEPADAVGRSTPLLDARDRVSGRAVFVDDLKLPDTLCGRFLRSPHAHARVVSIDTARALSIDGVEAVITGKDTHRRYGVLPISANETALAVDRVRYVGQEVAAVAACSEEVAARALRALDVEYEILSSRLKRFVGL